jgi:hypothetical protein
MIKKNQRDGLFVTPGCLGLLGPPSVGFIQKKNCQTSYFHEKNLKPLEPAIVVDGRRSIKQVPAFVRKLESWRGVAAPDLMS